MSLSFDVARCAGIAHRSPCQACVRREPGDPQRRVHMSPPPLAEWTFEAGFVLTCPQRIAPDSGC